MKCPICKQEVNDMKYRPFCSKKCADIDLGNWFNEKYSFAAQEVDDSELEQLTELTEQKQDSQ